MKKILVAAVVAAAFCGAPALAADMPVKASPTVPAPVYSWTGFYIGGNIGYGWTDPTITLTPNDGGTGVGFFALGAPPISVNGTGVLGGVEAGYNWQASNSWLVGVETDFDFAGIRGSGAVTYPTATILSPLTETATQRVDWFGTVRARLGYLPTENLLVFGTAGFAYGRVTQNGNLINDSTANSNSANGACPSGPGFVCFAGSGANVSTGWSVGGGLEYAIANNWSLKAEYLYVRLDGPTFFEPVLFGNTPTGVATGGLFAHSSDIDLNVVRGGLNYKF
jgi:outer membrane immunogenic protein